MSEKKALFHNATAQGITRIANPLAFLAVSLVLTPEDFGVIAMLTVFVVAFEIFSDMGMASAIVQRKDLQKGTLSTAFYVSVISSIVFGILLIVISATISNFLDFNIKWHIRALALVFVAKSFDDVSMALVQKDMDFKTYSRLFLVDKMSYNVALVLFAFSGVGAWCVVGGYIVSALIKTPLTWMARPIEIKEGFNISEAKKLWRFGKGIVFGRTLDQISSDTIIIGKLATERALGLYSIAFKICTLVPGTLEGVVAPVLFPLLSKQDTKKDIASKYYMYLKYTVGMYIPIALGIIALAGFIPKVIGEEWSGAVILVRIMAITGVFRVLSGPMASTPLWAMGKSDLTYRLSALKMIGLGASALFVVYGIEKVAISLTMFYVFYAAVVQYMVKRHFKEGV